MLFLGFSFFLITAALLLMALIFQFNVESRASETGVLLALGFEPASVRRILWSEGLLMAYIPAEKLLIQADAFAPRPGAAPLPAPSPYTMNLVENVERLKLDVQRVAHVHGAVDSWDTVLKAAGRSRTD